MSLRCCCLAVVSALVAMAGPAASAALVYDLRLATGGKSIVLTPTTTSVEMELYAMVTGSNGVADEGFHYGFGSILSSNGGNIRGSIIGTLTDDFSANTAQVGKRQDLDGDGDLDMGSNVQNINDDQFFARSDYTVTTGTAIPGGTEFKLADLTFVLTSVLSATDPTPIQINFRVPLFATAQTEALWQEDGKSRDSNESSGLYYPSVGLPVKIYAIPEPSAGWLAVFGLLAGVGRRRRAAVHLTLAPCVSEALRPSSPGR